MTTYGKSIRIHLIDGTVTGIRFGEIVNQTILLIACPRKRVTELKLYEEAKRQGVYFLFGNDEKTGEAKAYIGEGNVMDRLTRHLSEKEFWNEVILFVSKDENLTKGHVKYLESLAIKVAKETQRYLIENDNQSTSPLPRADKDAMEEFFIYIKLLLGTFGHKLLEELNPTITQKGESSLTAVTKDNQVIVTEKNLELNLFVSGLTAKAMQTDEGIVVLETSEASKDVTSSLANGYKAIRDRLIANGTLVLNNNKYVFQKNYLFDSASAAAAAIVGHNISGPQTWKDSTGKTLKQIEEQKLK
jgi:hypothetical protein